MDQDKDKDKNKDKDKDKDWDRDKDRDRDIDRDKYKDKYNENHCMQLQLLSKSCGLLWYIPKGMHSGGGGWRTSPHTWTLHRIDWIGLRTGPVNIL